MLSLELIKELCLLLKYCSDSDIEDFINDHHLSDEEAREWLEDEGLDLDNYEAYAWHLIEIDDGEYESVTVYR